MREINSKYQFKELKKWKNINKRQYYKKENREIKIWVGGY